MCAGIRLRGDVPDRAEVAGRVDLSASEFPIFVNASVHLVVCGVHSIHGARVSLSPTIERLWVCAFFFHRFLVPEVIFTLRQQPDVFMALGRSIGHALRHGIRFRPDDVRPHPPPVSLERQGETLWDQHHVFGLEVGYSAEVYLDFVRNTGEVKSE